MDNQVLKEQIVSSDSEPGPSVRKLALILFGIVSAVVVAIAGVYFFQHSDPYVRSVLSLEGDDAQGQVIFQMNCATCHGLQGDGVVGPSLHHVSSRKSRIGLIHQVTSGDTPPMPQFQPTPQAMADLLKFLEGL